MKNFESMISTKKLVHAIKRALQNRLTKLKGPDIWCAGIGRISPCDGQEFESVVNKLDLSGTVDMSILVELCSAMEFHNYDIPEYDFDVWRLRLSLSNAEISVDVLSHPDWNGRWLRRLEKLREPFSRHLEQDWGIPHNASVFEGGGILAASILVGTRPDFLGAITGFSKATIERVSTRLYEAKLWNAGKVDCHWCLEADQSSEFRLDCAVAQGLVKRYWSRQRGHHLYVAVN